MKIVQLKVEPFQFINFLEAECVKELNEHGVVKIKGLISEENRAAYRKLARKQIWVDLTAVDDKGKEHTLFNGVLTKLTMHSEHEEHTLSIEVKTGTFLLDRVPFTRSFQDGSLSFDSLISTCLDSEAGVALIHNDRAEQQTGRFIMQYRETNWSFIKRIITGLGVPLIPEFSTQGKRCHIGFNNQATPKEITSPNYTTTIIPETSQEVFNVNLRETYQLGERVIFEDTQLIIGKIETNLCGAELWHSYTLITELPNTNTTPRPALNGVALQAVVTNVSRDRVQIKIHDDVNKEESGHRWFNYATVYSTPNGTGFHAMPDVGTEVRLIFAEASEVGAYVASSVHLEEKGVRDNPEHKIWQNKQGKKILLGPDEILFDDDDGSLIELSGSKGIRMETDKDIEIQSKERIRINSQSSNVTISANEEVNIKQSSSKINIKDAIDISGGKINMN